MKDKITCRPCKEQNNWEIEDQNGQVLNEHFESKEDCVNVGRALAEEYGCELCVFKENE